MLKAEVQSFLQAHGIRLDTDQGQHFLVDDQVLEAIVQTANVQKSDAVIEIGPGIGILTRELVQQAKHVTAVEIDPRFPKLLKEFCGSPENLEIIQGNALHAELPTTESYSIVANIPYHITSPLLHRFLLEEVQRPNAMTLLIQKEVAENICSKTTDGILTLLVQLYGQPSLTYVVPPHAFLPPPKVSSAVLHIDLFEKPKGTEESRTKAMKLLKHANTERRKMLRNTMFNLPNGEKAMKNAHIDPTRRPQSLTVDEWLTLAGAFLDLS